MWPFLFGRALHNVHLTFSAHSRVLDPAESQLHAVRNKEKMNEN